MRALHRRVLRQIRDWATEQLPNLTIAKYRHGDPAPVNPFSFAPGTPLAIQK